MNDIGNWNYPTAIRFGVGRITELPDACLELNIHRPLLVTDPILAKLPITQQALQAVRSKGLHCGLFSDMQSNPVGRDVDAGVLALKKGKHDGVIAFGGGSALDVAKAVALMAHQVRPLWDFEDIGDYWTRVDESAMVPCVAVPTTSGTGSEVGRCSVIINENERKKALIFHPKMLPEKVIADPGLTLDLPAKITAAVGMDALSHNLEAFCAPGYHPQADGIALEGMRLVHRSLVAAYRDGQNRSARSDMMAASLMGATAFQKGLGAMHAMSHPLGAHLNAHHGLTNAIVMPYVLHRNRVAIEEKMDALARYLQLNGSGTDAVIEWVLSLRETLNIPHTLGAIGVEEHHCQQLAPHSVQDPTAGGNPISLRVDEYEKLYRDALLGRME